MIDRRAGDLVVVELDDGRVLELPGWLLPAEAGEGDVVRVEGAVDESGARRSRFSIDVEATRAARGAAERLLARLRAGDPGGNLEP